MIIVNCFQWGPTFLHKRFQVIFSNITGMMAILCDLLECENVSHTIVSLYINELFV